jgi:hypothetical protein
LTAIWSIVEGEAIELQYNEHGIATTMTIVGEGAVTLQATIGTFTETVTVTVAEPTALAQTKYYDMSASTDLTLDLAMLGITGNVTKMTVAGTEVTPVVEENTLTVADVETVLGYTSYMNTGAKETVIVTETAAYALNTVFVTKIIRQSDVSDKNPATLQKLLYRDDCKSVGENITNWHGYFVLGENIELDASIAALASNLSFITGTGCRFSGTFDGLGYSISNYTAGASGGLFTYLGVTAQVRNVNFVNAKIGNNKAYGIVGVLSYAGAVIENVHLEVTIGAAGHSDASAGSNGMLIRGNNATIKNCIVEVKDPAWTTTRHGYLVSENSGTMLHSYAIVQLTGTNTVYGEVVNSSLGGNTGDHTTCKVYQENCGAFYADTTVVNALAANGYNMRYWKFDSTAQTISMSANANDIK